MDSYESLMKGGQDGPVIAAGSAAKSVLFQRITLPPDHKQFMPAEGKPPLQPEEIAWIKAWIDQGASPTQPKLAGVTIREELPEVPIEPVGDYSALMPEIQKMGQGQGAKLKPVSAKPSDGLILFTVDAASTFGDAQLAQFQKFAPYIVEAELGRTAITDASFDTLKQFTHLRALHLEETKITGAGLAQTRFAFAIELSQSEWHTGYNRVRSVVEFNQEPAPRVSLQHAGAACARRTASAAARAIRNRSHAAQGEECAMRKEHRPANAIVNRRTFCAAAGATALAALAPLRANAEPAAAVPNNDAGGSAEPVLITGNGEWTYRVSQGWGRLPAGTVFGGTHGGIATDKAGHVYVSTQSATGILVYSPDGTLEKTIANQYPEVHSMVYAEENGEEYFYTTVQTGTPQENWLFVKMKTDGTVVQKITAPPEAGFKAPNEWRLTAAVLAPDGSIFIANGYGDSRLFRFDKNGNYRASFAGKGKSRRLVRLLPWNLSGHALRPAADAGVRSRESPSVPLRF